MKPETTGNKGATWPAVLLSLCILALAGCQGGAAKREVYAEYIVPPRVVADVSSLERMRIDAPKVAVNGSYPGKPQELSVLFEESLRERLDAKISRERFFEVADEIYDNDQGLTRIRQIMLDSRHGYDVKPAGAGKSALIKARAEVSLVRQEGVDTIATQLVTLPYVVQYADDKWRTPYAAANYGAQQTRTVTSKVPFIVVRAKANLTVAVLDTKGRKVYERGFKDLSYEKKVGGDAEAAAEPTVIEIVASLFDAPLRDVVADISPHKVTRAVAVNSGGDATAIALIRATAFSEAYKRLTELLETREAGLKKAAKTAREESAPQLAAAKSEAEKKALQAELAADLAKERKPLSADYENLAIACEAMGQWGEALDNYRLSAEADPGNATAAASLARVKQLAGQAGNLGLELKKSYDEQQHKER